MHKGRLSREPPGPVAASHQERGHVYGGQRHGRPRQADGDAFCSHNAASVSSFHVCVYSFNKRREPTCLGEGNGDAHSPPGDRMTLRPAFGDMDIGRAVLSGAKHSLGEPGGEVCVCRRRGQEVRGGRTGLSRPGGTAAVHSGRAAFKQTRPRAQTAPCSLHHVSSRSTHRQAGASGPPLPGLHQTPSVHGPWSHTFQPPCTAVHEHARVDIWVPACPCQKHLPRTGMAGSSASAASSDPQPGPFPQPHAPSPSFLSPRTCRSG